MSDVVSLIDEAAKKKKPWQKSSVLPKIAPPSSVPGAKKVRAADIGRMGKPGSDTGTSAGTVAAHKSPWNETGRTVYDPYYVTDSSGMFFYVVNPIKTLSLQTSDTPAKTIVVNYTDTTPT